LSWKSRAWVPLLVQERAGDAVTRFVAERLQRRVQELVDQPVERFADLAAGTLIEIRELVEQPAKFLLLGLLPALAELLDDRAGHAVAQVAHEPLGLLLDDPPRGRQFAVALGAVLVAGVLQVVD
jgi:hypothetical protein